MMLQKKSNAAPAKTAMQVSAFSFLFLAAAISIQSCIKKAEDTSSTQQAATEKKITDNIPKTKLPAEADASGIYHSADVMPKPTTDYQAFLANNIVYPKSAKERHIEGRVIVKFIVDENGNVKDPVILRSPDQALSDEALRVVSKMPSWTPGEVNGKKVAVYFTLPILFKLG